MEIWVEDFEFSAPPGHNPTVVCFCACEVQSGRQLRFWGDALPSRPPFAVDGSALHVAYASNAEWGAFLSLGWELPRLTLDLFPEFRLLRGHKASRKASLLEAARAFGIETMAVEVKDRFRDRILKGPPFSDRERSEILDYCMEDVTTTTQLLRRMWPLIVNKPKGLGHAVLRARYVKAVAHMERRGIPIDTTLLSALRLHWDDIEDRLTREVDARYQVFEDGVFKQQRFEALLARLGIAWPRTPTGRLSLDKDVFKAMARRYPELEDLRQLLKTRAQMRNFDLPVGPDKRTRTSLFPFGTKTGRNAPSRFVFGLAAWLRSLIKPGPGRAIIYADWCSQEIAVLAALSGDEQLLRAVRQDDPYLWFAVRSGLAPEGATRVTHETARNQCKALFLGIGYGMAEAGLAERLGCSIKEAGELLRLYRETFARASAWIERQCDRATLTGSLQTMYGWPLQVTAETRPNTQRNFLIQATAAHVLQLACSLAIERGLQINAPIHDALLAETAVEDLDTTVAALRACMDEASRAILGFAVKIDIKITRYPDRFVAERGQALFDHVCRLLSEIEHRQTA